MKSKILLLCLFFNSFISLAQSGILKGKVIEQKSKDGAIGATVKVQGTTFAAMTDVEGNFQVTNIPAGLYKITISSIGLAVREIDNVRIETGKISMLNTELLEDSKTLEGIVVKAQRMTGTEVSVISEIKQMQNIAWR